MSPTNFGSVIERIRILLFKGYENSKTNYQTFYLKQKIKPPINVLPLDFIY